ncbi:MAG TPA: tripartite tricarboxylate transporter substrate binding protein [Burkholderiales bacterium]|nr:tripartite tricarboxylate transporter substrate binding protein [Burkholderiales bacterium]
MRSKRWLLLVLMAAAGSAAAQSYPSKPVRFLVPYPAGGPTDAVARLIAPHLGLGQNVIVENRSGAGGSVGADVVAKAAPDGYMMLLGNSGPITINPVLRKDLPYHPKRDLSPVAYLTAGQMVLVAHPSLPVRSVKQLVALARTHPGSLNYGSAGIGNTTHLGMELFQTMAGVKLHHVPYKGVAPAYIDLIAGQLSVMFGNITGPLAHIQAGRLRAIAVTGPAPAAVLPGVPRVGDDYPGFELVTWMGIFLPAATPEPIRARLQNEFIRVLQMKDVRERLIGLGNDIVAGDGDRLSKHVDGELALYARIIKTAGIKAE